MLKQSIFSYLLPFISKKAKIALRLTFLLCWSFIFSPFYLQTAFALPDTNWNEAPRSVTHLNLKKNKNFSFPVSFNSGQNNNATDLNNQDTFEAQGIQYYQNLLQSAENEKKLIATTDKLHQRVTRILNRIIPYALKWHDRAQEWQWEIALIRSPKIDALALPGGKMIIYTGMINRLQLRDAEIAHLLAHLSAHAIREHAREEVLSIFDQHASDKIFIESEKNVTKDKIKNKLTFPVSEPSVYSLFEPFSTVFHDHADETEADIIGIDIATLAGFNPRAAINFWQKLALASREQKISFAQRHRYTFKREKALKMRIKANCLLSKNNEISN